MNFIKLFFKVAGGMFGPMAQRPTDPHLAEIEARYGRRPRIAIGHGEPLAKTHWRGDTADGAKFVYCPFGYLVSWHPGDYDHRWCPWCKESF